jgi:hypothetical protein
MFNDLKLCNKDMGKKDRRGLGFLTEEGRNLLIEARDEIVNLRDRVSYLCDLCEAKNMKIKELKSMSMSRAIEVCEEEIQWFKNNEKIEIPGREKEGAAFNRGLEYLFNIITKEIT